MDGKIDIFTAKQLLDTTSNGTNENQLQGSSLLGLPAPPQTELESLQFIETHCGACTGAVVKQDKLDMMIVGLEDGTLGVLNLTKTNGQSYRRPIFTMQN